MRFGNENEKRWIQSMDPNRSPVMFVEIDRFCVFFGTSHLDISSSKMCCLEGKNPLTSSSFFLVPGESVRISTLNST